MFLHTLPRSLTRSNDSDLPGPVGRRRHIRVETVQGDELFDAVLFLGHALDLPALLPIDDADIDEDVTAEFCFSDLRRAA